MASEDVNTALSLMRFVKEFWGVGCGLVMAGALYMYAKNTKDRIHQRLDGHDKDIEEIKKDMEGLAKSTELKEMKEDFLREMYALHGIERPYIGAERRKPKQ